MKKAAAANAADQLKRLFTLIPHIADGEVHTIADIAEIIGTSADQLVADLHSLVERFDIPGGFVEAVQIFHEGDRVSVVTPHFLRPMRLTMPELSALELGLAILRSERSGAELAPIERALTRLRTVITTVPGNEPDDDRMTGAAPAGSSSIQLSGLRRAIRGKKKARILYTKAAATKPESRVICPYRLVFASGAWYVVAHCDREKALRVFRLDRIREVAPQSDSYEIPSTFAVDEALVESKALMAEPGEEVLTVRYSAHIARWIAEREGVAVASDGSVTIEHPLHDDSWAVRHVLQYGPEAEVISPARIRTAIRERLA
jgi:proteasome accessory factor C